MTDAEVIRQQKLRRLRRNQALARSRAVISTRFYLDDCEVERANESLYATDKQLIDSLAGSTE